MSKFKFIFLTIGLQILFTFAVYGQRTIGSGGGLAETQIVALNQSLQIYLSLCLSAQNHCLLSNSEADIFQELLRTQDSDIQKFGIEFKPSLPGKVFQVEGNKILFSAQRLYDTQQVPLRANDLLAFVVAARILRRQPDVNQEQMIARCQEIFRGLKWAAQMTAAPLNSGTYKIRTLQLIDKNYESVFLFLETPAETLDLTQKLRAQFSQCRQLLWLTQNWRHQLSSNQLYFIGDFSYQCDQAPIDNQHLILSIPLIDKGKGSQPDLKQLRLELKP